MTLVACADFMLLLQRATCRMARSLPLCLHLPFPYLIAHLDKARLSCCLPLPLLPPFPLNPSCPLSLLCYSLACHCLLTLLTSIFIACHVFNVACRNFLRCFCSLLFVVSLCCCCCFLPLVQQFVELSCLQRGTWRGRGNGLVKCFFRIDNTTRRSGTIKRCLKSFLTLQMGSLIE